MKNKSSPEASYFWYGEFLFLRHLTQSPQLLYALLPIVYSLCYEITKFYIYLSETLMSGLTEAWMWLLLKISYSGECQQLWRSSGVPWEIIQF